MTGDSTQAPDPTEARWAKPVERIRVEQLPEGASSALNVEGRRLTGPLRGFGKMWQKSYQVRLTGVEATPQAVITTWKERYAEFWPKGNRFYAPLTGIAPGEVGLIKAGPTRLSTGVLVLYSDDVSFTFMTPEGHPFAGWITFSASDDDGSTVARADVQVRASDPLYEMGMVFGGSKAEDRMWRHTLGALAAHFGVEQPQVVTKVEVVDRRRQWRHFGAVRHNAAIRSMIYGIGAPIRLAARPFRRKRPAEASGESSSPGRVSDEPS